MPRTKTAVSVRVPHRRKKVATEKQDALFTLLTEELSRRGFSHPAHWSRLVVYQGINQARDRFFLVLSDCLSVAQTQLDNREIMDTVWQGLPNLPRDPQLEIPGLLYPARARRTR